MSRAARRAAALTAVGALALAACGSSTTSPSTAKAITGGTASFAESPGASPNYIFPIDPAADSSVFNITQFQDLMWQPLYSTLLEPKIDYTISLASAPVFTKNDTVATINMSHNYTWTNGSPVDAADVIFDIQLVEGAVKLSPANWGNFTPGQFPQNLVSYKATGKYQVTLTFNKTYNPVWLTNSEIGLITPLPQYAWDTEGGAVGNYAATLSGAEKVYSYLTSKSNAGSVSTFATNPLWKATDGPYTLTSYSTNGAATFTRNPHYTGYSKPKLQTFNEVPFTSNAAEFDQLLKGGVTIGYVPFSDLPSIGRVKAAGYKVYEYPDFGFQYSIFNFENKTFGPIAKQLYFRQAMAHLQNQPGIIKALYHGAAYPAYGVVPAIPPNPYTPSNAKVNPYPYSLRDAATLLAQHGWKIVPSGTDTCIKPGTGPGECGAGIPAGTPLTFNFLYGNSPATIGEQATALASNAKAIGIEITTKPETFNTLINNYSDPSAPANVNKWDMQDFGGFTLGTYPTTDTIFNTGGSYNIGDYNNATANTLINNTLYSPNPAAVKDQAAFLAENLPGLFQPNPDLIIVVKSNLGGLPDAQLAITQYTLDPNMFYYVK